MKLKYSNNYKSQFEVKFLSFNLFLAFNLLGIPENNDKLEGVYLKRPDFELL
jgi:hypothetical protein